MKHAAMPLALLATATGLAGQTVTATVASLTPASVQCTSGTQTASNSLPAGPLGFAYNTIASIAQGGSTQMQAMVDGFMIQDDGRVQVTATNFLYGTAIATPVTANASQDLLVQLSATSAAPVQITVAPRLELSAGVPAPLLEIDVGNDGQVDWIGMFGAASLGHFLLGTQPLSIRMRLVSSISVSPNNFDQSTAAINLFVEPDNQVIVTQNVFGCAGPGSMEPPAPVFEGRGVDILTSPAVVVIGFGTQPLLLGPQSPLPFVTGCLLLPTPDVLSWQPTGQLRLPLPPALRPLTLHVQAVMIGPMFALSDGYRIYAF